MAAGQGSLGSVSLSELPDSFGLHFLPSSASLRQRQQGKRFAVERYIQSIKLQKHDDRTVDIVARVHPSQRKHDRPHQINMVVDKIKCGITDAACTCKAGTTGRCSHIVATILLIEEYKYQGLKEIPDQPSCTSKPQSWDRPRGVKIAPVPVTQMVMSKPDNDARKRKPIHSVYIDSRNLKLEPQDTQFLQSLDCPIGYLSQGDFVASKTEPELLGSALSYHAPLLAEKVPLPTPVATDCAVEAYPASENLSVPLPTTVLSTSLTLERCQQIEKETRNQADDSGWFTERKTRITASKFGKIMMRVSAPSESFLKQILINRPFTSRQTSYGTANESTARAKYVAQTGNHVHNIGLVTHPLVPFLGATPDGRVCSKDGPGILEIKCPYSCRDMLIEDACAGGNFHLDENRKLRMDHEYWFQVQGQLLLTGASFCDFVTYTRRSLQVERVMPHPETFIQLLRKLSDFYQKYAKEFFDKL